MVDRHVALYARVSTEQQARDATIASQLAALREHIAADGRQLEPDRTYLDEGCSGSSLLRPALERLRDAVAAGDIERLYVHAPDRLARRHAHPALLMEEFRRAGVEVVFLDRPIGGTAEDDRLLQIQGVIAEDERARSGAAGAGATRPVPAWSARSRPRRSATATSPRTGAAAWRASR